MSLSQKPFRNLLNCNFDGIKHTHDAQIHISREPSFWMIFFFHLAETEIHLVLYSKVQFVEQSAKVSPKSMLLGSTDNVLSFPGANFYHLRKQVISEINFFIKSLSVRGRCKNPVNIYTYLHRILQTKSRFPHACVKLIW